MTAKFQICLASLIKVHQVARKITKREIEKQVVPIIPKAVSPIGNLLFGDQKKRRTGVRQNCEDLIS